MNMTFNMVQLSLIAKINVNLDITAPIVSEKHTEYRVKNAGLQYKYLSYFICVRYILIISWKTFSALCRYCQSLHIQNVLYTIKIIPVTFDYLKSATSTRSASTILACELSCKRKYHINFIFFFLRKSNAIMGMCTY